MKTNINKRTGLVITMDGQLKIVTPKNGRNFTLDEMQHYVGGLIDIVYYPNEENFIMVCNDEGIYTKEFNLIGSLFLTMKYERDCAIYGDVLICHTSMVK